MTRTRTTRAVAAFLALGLVAAACGGDDDAPPATEAPAPDPDPDDADDADDADDDAVDDGDVDESAAVDLSGVCPSPLVIQTDWFPESEYGPTYKLIGEPYTIDVGNKTVTGPLWDQGQPTGIDVEVRTGGPAIGFSEPRVQMYSDDSIHIGYSSIDAAALTWNDAPLVSVVAMLDINPQIIMWDPEAWPEVESIADLGEAGVVVNVFAGGGFSEVFVAQGIWSADQVDPSYDGSPARFIAEGNIAQQGFASNEPFMYEFVFEDFGRPVAFQLLHDAGYEIYSQTLAVRPDALEDLRPCLELFVPVFQRAIVGFVENPDRTNALIVDAVEQFDDFWVYEIEVADFAVEKIRELNLMGNGPDSTIGNFDLDRIEGVLADIRDAGANVPDGLTANDLVTNEFIDPTIGL